MPGPWLFLELGSDRVERGSDLAEADGFVLGPDGATEPPAEQVPSEGALAWVLRGVTPLDRPAWHERGGVTWVCQAGLEATARLRDGWPSLTWVPRVEAFRPPVRYDFIAASPGEGFSVYRPDTSAIQGYRTVDDGDETIEAWFARAGALGFRTVWVESRDAGQRGEGLDLDLLDRVRGLSGGGRIWLSGGATTVRHIANLAAEGGAAAVIVPAALAATCGCAALLGALGRTPEGPVGASRTRPPREGDTCPG